CAFDSSGRTLTGAFLDRVETVGQQLPLRLGSLARLSEAEVVERPEAHLARRRFAVPAQMSIEAVAEQPRLVDAAILTDRDLQIEAVTVEVSAGSLLALYPQRADSRSHLFEPPTVPTTDSPTMPNGSRTVKSPLPTSRRRKSRFHQLFQWLVNPTRGANLA